MTWMGRSSGGRRSPEPGGHERPGAWIVDRAVRALVTGCAEQGRAVPAAGALIVGAETVTLRLTTPDEAPPPGWTADDLGRTWRAALRWLDTAAADLTLPEPYPLLVSVGETGDGRLLLNLAEAGGLISVNGDQRLARGVIRSWARRLASVPWAAGARVIRVGFPADGPFDGWDVPRLGDADLTMREPGLGVVLFPGRPEGRDLHLVDQLLADPARRWRVVVAGAEDAAWRFTVHEDGTIDTGLLAEPVLLRV